MTTPHRLALIGFGTVGLAGILLAKGDDLGGALWRAVPGRRGQRSAQGQPVQPRRAGPGHAAGGGAADGQLRVRLSGNPAGRCSAAGTACALSARATPTPSSSGWTDVQTGQPAIDHVKAAFKKAARRVDRRRGRWRWPTRRLAGLAGDKGVQIAPLEGTVMSGTPTIRLAQRAHQLRDHGDQGHSQRHHRLHPDPDRRRGQSYADALAEAQGLGYAEADSTADVRDQPRPARR